MRVPTQEEMESYLRAAEKAHADYEKKNGAHADWVPFYAEQIIALMQFDVRLEFAADSARIARL